MSLKCILFSCKKFHYIDDTTRKCISCGKDYVFVKFYPGRQPMWLEKDFVDHWKTYENLVNAPMVCEACDNKLDNNGECGCNAC